MRICPSITTGHRRQSPGATRAGSLRSGRAMHNQPVTSVPAARPRAAPQRRGQRHHAPTRPHPAYPRRLPDFPSTPTSAQPWNPEPLATNHNQCPQPSAVIIKANTNADNPTTPGGDVSSRQTHTRTGARHVRVQRDRHLAVHPRCLLTGHPKRPATVNAETTGTSPCRRVHWTATSVADTVGALMVEPGSSSTSRTPAGWYRRAPAPRPATGRRRPAPRSATPSRPPASPITTPDPPAPCPQPDRLPMDTTSGLSTTGREILDVTTVTEQQRCPTTSCASSPTPLGRVRPGPQRARPP